MIQSEYNKKIIGANEAAFILFSGGIESTYNLYYWMNERKHERMDIYVLYINYEQLDNTIILKPEFESAKQIIMLPEFKQAMFFPIEFKTPFLTRHINFYIFLGALYAINSVVEGIAFFDDNHLNQSGVELFNKKLIDILSRKDNF